MTTSKVMARWFVLSLALAGSAVHAQAAHETSPAEKGVASSSATLVPLNRFADSWLRRWTALVPPYGDIGYTLEGASGWVSSVPFEGSHPLYGCYLLDNGILGHRDDFTSTDPNCEGRYRHPGVWGENGHVASTQIQGTIPLYRCLVNNGRGYFDHFDTVHANCEGRANSVNEFVLGYVFH